MRSSRFSWRSAKASSALHRCVFTRTQVCRGGQHMLTSICDNLSSPKAIVRYSLTCTDSKGHRGETSKVASSEFRASVGPLLWYSDEKLDGRVVMKLAWSLRSTTGANSLPGNLVGVSADMAIALPKARLVRRSGFRLNVQIWLNLQTVCTVCLIPESSVG